MTVYSFVVRKAKPEDAEAIYNILQEAFRKYMTDTSLKGSIEALEETIEQIKKETLRQHVFIACINDEPVGTIRYEIDEKREAHISRFGVRLDFHNIGIGKSLMNLVDSEIEALGVKKAYLYSASKYTDLIKFYYGRGFYIESTSTDKGYVRAKLVKEF
ncbi:MAG: GNAT family N-acetyltransferase [Clostridia bacterium]|nr:GNAT family N-acetyltransferase [Clostridia bacterium]